MLRICSAPKHEAVKQYSGLGKKYQKRGPISRYTRKHLRFELGAIFTILCLKPLKSAILFALAVWERYPNQSGPVIAVLHFIDIVQTQITMMSCVTMRYRLALRWAFANS